MRILHVIRGLANSSGTTHIVNPLAEEQARLGHYVRVLHVERPGSLSVLPVGERVSDFCFKMTLPFMNPGISIGLARAMTAQVEWADVVHIHAVWNFPTWWAMRCAHRGRKPFMVAPQGSFDPWALQENVFGKRVYGALIEIPWLQRATRLQALSLKEADQFRKNGLLAPSVVIPNGIPSTMFTRGPTIGALARDLGLPVGSRALLFLSRVHPKKGLDLLLRSFSLIAEEFPDVYLVVAGHDGGSGYKDEMIAFASQLGLSARCLFIGEVVAERKKAILMGADAWALISRSEGLPVAALEALGAGLPCVLSEECNLPEVGDFGAGWTVAAEIGATANALAELLANRSEATLRGERARRMVADRFTWEQIAARTVDVYREISVCSAG